MTATSTVPDRLLALGSEFTRHHDALQDIHLLRGANPAGTLLRHLPTTQTLARGALQMADALHTAPQLYHSPDVRAGMERATQLGALATLAADHLIDAVNLLRGQDTIPTPREALLEAGRHTTLAGRLTSLGAEDCLAAAQLIARELHRQDLGTRHRPPALSPLQRSTLEAIAAGHITLDRLLDKVCFRRGDARIPITTIRSLETRKLVHREPCALILHDERVHLTAAGCHALATALSQTSATTPAATRPPARPAATPTRTAAR